MRPRRFELVTGSGLLALMLTVTPLQAQTQLQTASGDLPALPDYLRDRGPGVGTSMFGTYVRKGELLVYPFFEWYADSDLEYTPDELGFGSRDEHRGRYRAAEGLLFLGYGVTDNLAVELEAALIHAELRKSPLDRSAMPAVVKESGLGDVEAQVRWRWLQENDARPEAFSYFETVFPLQRRNRLIGTPEWEYKAGIGVTRGFRWGTATFRVDGEYSGEEQKFDAGEYAFEYLKRLSPKWRVYGAIEGYQLDEVSLITEVQWHFHPRAFLKANNGWGLTTNATDFAPEIGLMIAF
ncbi:MAG TPA: hypothetical protein VIK60_10555 [Vicinamibacterales bacterium]